MELGHIFTGQIIFLSSLLATISLSENSKSAYSLKYLTDLTYVKVTGEKGALLLLFGISSIFVFFLDFCASYGKITTSKNLSKNSKKACKFQVKCMLISFISFISAYIFQSLRFRTTNLLGIALLTTNLNSISILLGIETLSTFFYTIFMTSNLLVLSFTFLKDVEFYYSLLVSYLKFK